MPIKSKVFIQTLQKSQDRQKISFAFEFNIENTKSLRGKSAPPLIQLSWIYPPIPLGLKFQPGSDHLKMRILYIKTRIRRK